MADERASFPTRPSLVGKNVYLRPLNSEDVANITYWTEIGQPDSMTSRLRHFWTPAEAAENYKRKERTTSEQGFGVIRKKDKALIGCVRYFNYNPRNRSAELGLIIDPDERKKGYGKEAVQILARHLFQYVGLNKVCAETAEFNEGAVKLLETLGFKKDGTLRDHFFYKGEFHNGRLYSLLLYEVDW